MNSKFVLMINIVLLAAFFSDHSCSTNISSSQLPGEASKGENISAYQLVRFLHSTLKDTEELIDNTGESIKSMLLTHWQVLKQKNKITREYSFEQTTQRLIKEFQSIRFNFPDLRFNEIAINIRLQDCSISRKEWEIIIDEILDLIQDNGTFSNSTEHVLDLSDIDNDSSESTFAGNENYFFSESLNSSGSVTASSKDSTTSSKSEGDGEKEKIEKVAEKSKARCRRPERNQEFRDSRKLFSTNLEKSTDALHASFYLFETILKTTSWYKKSAVKLVTKFHVIIAKYLKLADLFAWCLDDISKALKIED